MAAYIIASYRVTRPEGFGLYPAKATETLMQHGAEILVVDMDTEVIEGETRPVTVILKFDSKAAARAWYDSPEYQAALPLRAANSEGSMVLVDGFVPPS